MATIGILLLNVLGGLAGAIAAGLFLRWFSLGFAGNCLAGIVGGCLGGQMIHLGGRGAALFFASEFLAGAAFGVGMVLLFGFIRRSNDEEWDEADHPAMADSQLNP